MNLWSAISIGLKEIWAHKFRSLLTMLGIILGASSLIAMSALVKGREVAAKEALIATGGLQKIRIEPQEVPIQQWQKKDQAVGVTINDAYALDLRGVRRRLEGRVLKERVDGGQPEIPAPRAQPSRFLQLIEKRHDQRRVNRVER